jgi:hypothetical protein
MNARCNCKFWWPAQTHSMILLKRSCLSVCGSIVLIAELNCDSICRTDVMQRVYRCIFSWLVLAGIRSATD